MNHTSADTSARNKTSGLVVDPVCGMTVNPDATTGSYEFEGKTYYFCSAHCLDKFRADPEQFLSKSIAPGASQPVGIRYESKPIAAPGAQSYTCPMHPQIVSGSPGSCPICGMALEPRTITLDEETNPELVDMTRRFWVSAALTVPLFGIAMSEFLPGNPIERIASMRVLVWIELVLATPVVVWGGWPFFVRFWQSIVNRSLNMFTLIGLGR